jgi:hypothetical protein
VKRRAFCQALSIATLQHGEGSVGRVLVAELLILSHLFLDDSSTMI